MIPIRVLSIAGVLVMAVAIGAAYSTGDFFGEGSAIWAFPWGKVTLIDLYVGLVFFGAWTAYREEDWRLKAVWLIGLVVLGNLIAAIYLAVAAFSSKTVAELLSGKQRSPGP